MRSRQKFFIRNKVSLSPPHLPAPKAKNAATEEPLRDGTGGEGAGRLACLSHRVSHRVSVGRRDAGAGGRTGDGAADERAHPKPNARKKFTTPPGLAPLGLLWYLAPSETAFRSLNNEPSPKMRVENSAPEFRCHGGRVKKSLPTPYPHFSKGGMPPKYAHGFSARFVRRGRACACARKMRIHAAALLHRETMRT